MGHIQYIRAIQTQREIAMRCSGLEHDRDEQRSKLGDSERVRELTVVTVGVKL